MKGFGESAPYQAGRWSRRRRGHSDGDGPARRWGGAVRLQDLRYTHATLPLADGSAGQGRSERSGHASATITLTLYQHVQPGMGAQAADRFAALLKG